MRWLQTRAAQQDSGASGLGGGAQICMEERNERSGGDTPKSTSQLWELCRGRDVASSQRVKLEGTAVLPDGRMSFARTTMNMPK